MRNICSFSVGTKVKNVIDLDPLPGTLASVSLELKTGYLGVVLSEAHAVVLFDRLLSEVLGGLSKPNSPFFSASYCKEMGIKTTSGSDKHKAAKPDAKVNEGKSKDGQEDPDGIGKSTGSGTAAVPKKRVAPNQGRGAPKRKAAKNTTKAAEDEEDSEEDQFSDLGNLSDEEDGAALWSPPDHVND